MIYLMGKELNLKVSMDIMDQLDEELCKSCSMISNNCKNEYCERYETEFDIRKEFINNEAK